MIDENTSDPTAESAEVEPDALAGAVGGGGSGDPTCWICGGADHTKADCRMYYVV